MQHESGTLPNSIKVKTKIAINNLEPVLNIIGNWLSCSIYGNPKRFVPYGGLSLKDRLKFWTWIIVLTTLITIIGAIVGSVLGSLIYALFHYAPQFVIFVGILVSIIVSASYAIKVRNIDDENINRQRLPHGNAENENSSTTISTKLV